MFNTKYVRSKGLAFAENVEMAMLSLYAREGWILDKFGLFGYKLKKAKPQRLQYSLDYRSKADEEYFSYFKQAGWTHVCSMSNTIHIFSAPEGTNPIYTDSDTESEKYISQYKSTKQLAIPSCLCSILCIILVSLAKYNYIPDIYRQIFGMILIPTIMITIISTFPCISYYFKINEIKGSSISNKKYKTIKELTSKLARIMLIVLISLFLLSHFNIINISKSAFYSICLISVLINLSSCFMPCNR